MDSKYIDKNIGDYHENRTLWYMFRLISMH